MPTPTKNRLLSLEKTLTRRQGKAKKRPGKSAHRPKVAAHKRRARVRAQALDQGEPIELLYNETTESYDSAAMSYEAADAELEAEAFDWDGDNEPEAEAFDWDDENVVEAEAFDWEADDDTEAQALELNEDDAEAFEVEAFEADDEEGSDDSELAEDFDFSDLDGDDEPSRAFSETDFAADLQAIINGEKTYDRDNGGMVNTGGGNDQDQMTTAQSVTTAEETPEADGDRHAVFSQMSQHMPHNRLSNAPLAQAKSQAADSGEQVEDPHEVFKALGHNMSHASSFDLGSISMEQTFEDLNEKLDKAEEKIQARAETIQKKASDQEISAPLALNDAALVNDLDQIHEAMANDDDSDEDNDTNLDDDTSNQAIQLAIDGVAYVTKTDKGGAYLHSIETNPAGDITNVKTVKGRVRVPTGAQVLIDTGKTKDDYIWAHHNNKTGAIRKSSVVMLETAAKPASVLVSDVVVTDQGIQEKQTAPFYRINLRGDEEGGTITEFLQMDQLKTVPLGAKMLVHPGVHSTDSDSIIWAMHVSGADTKVGAVNKGDVCIASEIDNDNNFPRPQQFASFFEKCWNTPSLKSLYRGFMRTQYNAENLDFLSAVAQIRNQAQAGHVVDVFVKPDVKRSVNLGYERRTKLIEAITNPPANGYPDWRIPFGFYEQNGTTFVEHITAPNGGQSQDLLNIPDLSPCREIYNELGKQEPKPQLKNSKERDKYIAALLKDPGG